MKLLIFVFVLVHLCCDAYRISHSLGTRSSPKSFHRVTMSAEQQSGVRVNKKSIRALGAISFLPGVVLADETNAVGTFGGSTCHFTSLWLCISSHYLVFIHW